MKKIISLFAILLFVTGCGGKKHLTPTQIIEPVGEYTVDYYEKTDCGSKLLDGITKYDTSKEVNIIQEENKIYFYEYDSKAKDYDMKIATSKANLSSVYICKTEYCGVAKTDKKDLYSKLLGIVFIYDNESGNVNTIYNYVTGEELYSGETQINPLYEYTNDNIFVLYGYTLDNDIYNFNNKKVFDNSNKTFAIIEGGKVSFNPMTCQIVTVNEEKKYETVSLIEGNSQVISGTHDAIYYSDLETNKGNNVYVVLDDKKVSILDKNGKELLPEKYYRVYVEEHPNYPNGILVLYNEAGDLVIKDYNGNNIIDEVFETHSPRFCSMQSYADIYYYDEEGYGKVDAYDYCPKVEVSGDILLISYYSDLDLHQSFQINLIDKTYVFEDGLTEKNLEIKNAVTE